MFSVRFGMSSQVKSNQIKSNQIKSYFPISHIPYDSEYLSYLPEFEWVKEDLYNHHQNTINISSHFISIYFSWLMCCHNFHDHWWLLCDYLDYYLQETKFHRMKWYVVWEDLEWEMKWNEQSSHTFKYSNMTTPNWTSKSNDF